MPSYTMRHKETGETKDMILSLSEREVFLNENADWEQAPATPLLVSGVKTALRQTDDGWKDTLKKIKSGSGKANTINV